MFTTEISSTKRLNQSYVRQYNQVSIIFGKQNKFYCANDGLLSVKNLHNFASKKMIIAYVISILRDVFGLRMNDLQFMILKPYPSHS